MFLLSRPSPERLDRVLAEASAQSPTFDHIGATRSADRVPGFRYDSYAAPIGHGQADWDAACNGLRVWAAHAGARVSITPHNAPLVEGQTVVASTSVGPMHVLIPCRIVYVLDESNRFGFAYATLPGHPECGEEAFMLSRSDEGEMTFTVSAHSHPADLMTRLGGPISRLVQQRTNHAYVAGLAAFVERSR
jgi:uncharacterized protein (UPF0548 family)